MPDKLEEYRPILDPVYRWSTSCSIDEALKYLFGWLRGPIRDSWGPGNDHPDGIDMCDISLDEILTNDRESADVNYSNAKLENASGEIIAEKLAELKKCDLLIEKAHRFLCDIDDEIAKGENSALRIDQITTKNPKLPYITIASLDQWARDKYNIHIFNPLHAQTGTEEETSLKGGLSKTKATNLRITFALLVEEFATKAPGYQNNGKPNVSTIAREIAKLAKKDPRGLSGQSEEAIKGCIEDAMKIKENPPI
jgi:hypothetical protein